MKIIQPGIYEFRGFQVVSDKHPGLHGNWAIYSPAGLFFARAATVAEARRLILSQFNKENFKADVKSRS